MDLIWYETDLPFQDSESVINSLDWDEEPWRPRVVGEVYGAARRYNGLHQIPGLTGQHQCGNAADFANGAPWPHTGPLTTYDKDHIPTCCNRALVGFVKSGARPAALVFPPNMPTALVTSSARPAALVTAHYRPAVAVTSSARPAALVSKHTVPAVAVTSGARPASPVKVYCNEYTFSCSGTYTVTWVGVGTLDHTWRNATNPDILKWRLNSPHSTGTPGLWRLFWTRSLPGPTFETWQVDSPWDGRGTSPTFTRINGPWTPEKCASCTISCAD